MMWHDMLLCRDDPRWDGYIVCGHSSSGLADLYRKLPQDIIICDWQYGDPAREGKDPEWPTSHFFRQAGFDVLVCPWLERSGIESLGHLAAESGFFGLLETTWSRTHGSHDLETLFAAGAEAAWNPDAPVYPGIVRREYLNRHLREVTHDAGLGSYVQFGSIQHQIAPMPFGEV